MSTLGEIEAAADNLPLQQKEELILFLVTRLRAEGAKAPLPRTFSADEVSGWIREDEADMRRIKEGS